MSFVLLNISPYGNYLLKKYSDEKVAILGHFLSSDVGCHIKSFKDFVFNDEELATNSNATYLEKENGFILLGDLYSDEQEPTELKMTYQQFIEILDEWYEKVCKHTPRQIIIRHENDQFSIEAHD